MPVWFIFVLISILAVSIAEISQKLSMVQKVNISSVTNNFYVWTLMGIYGLIISTITRNYIPIPNQSNYIKLLILGVIYFLGGTFYYASYKGNSPSISQILGNISVIITTILGIFWLKEDTSWLKFTGIFLILLAVFILNITKKEKYSKYNLLALLGGICYGFAYSLDKSFALNLHPFNYLVWMSFSVALVSLIIKSKLIFLETKKMILKDFRPILSSSVFFTIFDVCNFFAYKNGASVGVLDSMNSIAVFLVILAEILFLKDKTNVRIKIFCASIAAMGVILFSHLK